MEEISECIDADGTEFVDDCDSAVLVVAGEDLIDADGYDLIDDSYADSIEDDSADFIAADMISACDADMKSASDACANDDADKINAPDDAHVIDTDGRDADDNNDDDSVDFIGGSREFISHQIMFHNIVEMLRKLEEVQRKCEQIWSDHDQIWLSDLQIWKHRTQCRITELRILLGGVGIATDSYFYSTVVYRPDNEKTDDIVRYVNSQYDNIRNKGKLTCRAI